MRKSDNQIVDRVDILQALTYHVHTVHAHLHVVNRCKDTVKLHPLYVITLNTCQHELYCR